MLVMKKDNTNNDYENDYIYKDDDGDVDDEEYGDDGDNGNYNDDDVDNV